MLSSVEPWDMVADGYSKTTMKFFQGYVEQALQLAQLSKEDCVLDVACGPGTLTLQAASLVSSICAIDFSESMTAILRKNIEENSISNIEVTCQDAQNLPYEKESFDVAFSMFGLMFFPDKKKGFSEIYRTLKPGGKIIVSSWGAVSKSPAMETMFGAVRAMKPELPEPQTEVASLENPEFFRNELIDAGFQETEVHLVTQEFPILSISSFWEGMVEGNVPIVMMKNSMSSDEWQEKEKLALQYLENTLTSLPTTLSADAWFGYGVK